MGEGLLESYPILFGVIGAIVSIGTLGTSLYFGLRKGKSEHLTAKEAQERYIDGKIKDYITLAEKRIADLEAEDARKTAKIAAQDRKLEEQGGRIAELERSERDAVTKASAAARETEELRGIVRRWWVRLTSWHRAGHQGEMPMPADSDMALLDLSPAV